MPSPQRTRGESGAAIVDFVLVLLILIPLFLGILQLALVLHVRNTVSSAVAEGARYAATWEATPEDGVAKARDQYAGVVSDDMIGTPSVELVDIEGAPAYRMTVDVAVPALGIGGPAIAFQVSGNAMIEPDPRPVPGPELEEQPGPRDGGPRRQPRDRERGR